MKPNSKLCFRLSVYVGLHTVCGFSIFQNKKGATEVTPDESVNALTGNRIDKLYYRFLMSPCQASYRHIACDLSGCVDFLLTGGGLGLMQLGLERTGTALERESESVTGCEYLYKALSGSKHSFCFFLIGEMELCKTYKIPGSIHEQHSQT